jgi:arylsulfatase A-like enzyme
MSSTTVPTALQKEVSASPLISSDAVGALKLTAFTLFGLLLLLDSLYLALCYITFDFFGALNSPFFGWLRAGASAAQVLYFPLLAGAVLSIDVGAVGTQKRRAHAVAAVFLLLQLAVGFLSYFLWTGQKIFFGWVLVYGPHLRAPWGELCTYFEAVACLVPLTWISALHIASSCRTSEAKANPNTMKLGSFLVAAIITSLLYQGTAMFRMASGHVAFSIRAVAIVVAAQAALFVFVFLMLQWIRIIANLFPNPGLAQFALRCVGSWALLAFVLKKLVLALFVFTDQYAAWYAATFSLALVIFPAALILRIRQKSGAAARQNQPAGRLWYYCRRGFTAAGIPIFFYLCAVKFAPIDWAHAIGSIGAMMLWAGILWFCVTLRPSQKNYSPMFLALLSVVCLATIGGVSFAVSRGASADAVEQYSDFDGSAFVIQHAFKPVLENDKYESWYRFLNDHGSIRATVDAAQVPLVAELKPVNGRKPHIFMFVIDALRRDYVSAYNPAVRFTPNLESFAHESVVFQHAYSQYAGTALADPGLWSGFQQINKTFAQPLWHENNLQPMLDVDGYDCYISYNTIVGFLSKDPHRVTGLNTDRSDQLDFGPIAEQLQDDLLNRKDTRQPIFAFAQPTNVHTLSLAWHGAKIEVKPHPGFDDAYASAVERVDETFGRFIAFLKQHGLYDDSIVIVTADHGESLGEMGRQSHVANVTPEVIEIPLLIHLPEWEQSKMVWDSQAVATIHDITPTLYYLVGHRPLNDGELLGRPLFTLTQEEQKQKSRDHYFLMSSYGAVFGILAGDRKSLFMVDAMTRRNYYYDLQDDPRAFKNRVTIAIRDRYEPVIRQELENIDRFYNVSEQELSTK